MSKHKHAELMLQYAQDALQTDKPWERWEYRVIRTGEDWSQCDTSPGWIDGILYRRKPDLTGKINIGIDRIPISLRPVIGLDWQDGRHCLFYGKSGYIAPNNIMIESGYFSDRKKAFVGMDGERFFDHGFEPTHFIELEFLR